MFQKLKKLGFVTLFAIMAISLVSFVAADVCDNEGFECECPNFYDDMRYYSIQKWEFDDGKGDYVIDEESDAYSYYNIKVSGDLHDADWSASPNVHSVLVKAGNNREEFNGGDEGTFDSEKEISHVTFCGYRNGGGGGCVGDDCGGGSVPEFPGFSLAAAVVGVGLGLVYLRKD